MDDSDDEFVPDDDVPMRQARPRPAPKKKPAAAPKGRKKKDLPKLTLGRITKVGGGAPPPVPPPTKKIVQLMPVDTPCWYLVGDAYEPRFGECGDFVPMHPMSQCITQPGLVRRVACHALVEDQHGTRWMEPMLHLTTKDLEEWMGTQPGDGQGLIFGATLDDCSLKKHTGGVARRTLLASDWFEKMLVPVLCEECGIMETNLWAHVLVAAEPPAEYGFSGGRTTGRELGQEAAL